MLDKAIQAFISIVTIPAQMLRAIFYVPTIQKDGSVKRTFFSITRVLFVVACVVTIYRLVIGGLSIDMFEFGPNVLPSTNESTKKRISKLRAAKAKLHANKNSRGTVWLRLRGLKTTQLSFYEVVALIVIALIYFFRNQLDAGDKSGLLEKVTAAYLASRGIKMDLSTDGNVVSVPQSKDVKEEIDVEIDESSLPVRGIG
jgi:hypothetical protein